MTCKAPIPRLTKPSSATRTVPAAGPYSSTAVNTNVSDIDIEAYVDGKRTVADPLTRVRPAMMNHWDSIGCRISPKIELAITPTPTEITDQRKIRPSRDNFRLDNTFRPMLSAELVPNYDLFHDITLKLLMYKTLREY